MDNINFNFSVSSLKDHEMIATYCGLRPRSPEFHDYQIRFNKDLSWATLGAIRSTGLTASRSIAEYCAKNLFSNEPYEVGYPQLLSKNIYRGSPTSTVSTSTIFIAIGIKSVLVEFSRIGYVVKFVLVEIAM